MSETETLEIGKDCSLNYSYGEFDLTYTEHATWYWEGDNETTLEINEELALKIIQFLSKRLGVVS